MVVLAAQHIQLDLVIIKFNLVYMHDGGWGSLIHAIGDLTSLIYLSEDLLKWCDATDKLEHVCRQETDYIPDMSPISKHSFHFRDAIYISTCTTLNISYFLACVLSYQIPSF